MSSNLRFIVGGCAVVVAGAILLAGPLNPPTGPVSAGGKTTQEIYDAVTNIGGSIGTVGGRGPAVPGSNVAAGTFSMNSSSQSFSGPIIGLRLGVKAVVSGGGGGGTGQTLQDGCTIIREQRDGTGSAYRLTVTGTHSMTATAVIPAVGGSTTYLWSDVVISGFRQYQVQRADGTFCAIEELDMTYASLRVTDAGGRTYSWNFSTSVGTP